MKMRYLAYLSLVLLAASLARPAGAQGSTEAVINFAQTATLNRAGTLTVTQVIDYDYATATTHDITYRLPISYPDDQGRPYRSTFKLLEANVDGAPVRVTPKINPQIVQLTLPAIVGQGSVRRFSLRYTLAPIVLVGHEADTFHLPVTGLAWSVPIERASLELHTPMPVDNFTCYTGTATTNTSSCITAPVAGPTASLVTDAPLPPGAILTASGSFAHRSFTNYLQPYSPPHSWLGFGLELALVIIALTTLLIGLVLAIRALVPRRPPRQSIVRTPARHYTNAHDTAPPQDRQDQADRH